MIRWCLSQRYKQNSIWLPWFSRFRRRLYEPGGSDSKASACNVGDQGSVSRSGRSPGEGNGYPLKYSCLENSMARGAWWVTDHGIAKNQTQLTEEHTYTRSLRGVKTNIRLLLYSGQDKLGLRRGSENHHNMLFPEIQKHIVHFIFFTSLLGSNYVLSGLPW